MQYIGETGRRLADRFRERICYVKSANLTQPTYWKSFQPSWTYTFKYESFSS